jgi:hypothetical protein
MNGYNVGKAGKHCGDRAILFGSLPMDDVRLNLHQFSPDSACTAKEQRAHPPNPRYMEAVKINVGRQFFRRLHRDSSAGQDMKLRSTQLRKSLKQCFRRSPKIGYSRRVIFEVLTVIGRDYRNSHSFQASRTRLQTN